MTPSTLYKLRQSLRLKFGTWPTDEQLTEWIEHLRSHGVVIGESE